MNIALRLALAADVRTVLAAHVRDGEAGLSPALVRDVDVTVERLLQGPAAAAEVSLAAARALVEQAAGELMLTPAFGVLAPRTY